VKARAQVKLLVPTAGNKVLGT
jgi:hypothetical protein